MMVSTYSNGMCYYLCFIVHNVTHTLTFYPTQESDLTQTIVTGSPDVLRSC